MCRSARSFTRSSVFTYKGKPTRIEDVGRELGVRYVLEGSVRREGEQLRLSAQLSDATRGLQIWSQRYDRDLTDVFAVQSEITAFLGLAQWRVGRLEEAVRTEESVRETYPEQLPGVLWLAAQYEASGRHDEAQAVVAEVRQVNPELRADRIGECIRSLLPGEIPVFQENLRRAGLP